jgi:hypothetical protein
LNLYFKNIQLTDTVMSDFNGSCNYFIGLNNLENNFNLDSYANSSILGTTYTYEKFKNDVSAMQCLVRTDR